MTATPKNTCQIRQFGEAREHDNRFVRKCQTGDASAWNELITRHSRRVYSLCYRFTQRDCEARELTQEVFMRVFCTLSSFRAEELSFAAWLTLVARNLLIDHYRHTRQDRQAVSIDDQWETIQVFENKAERPDRAYARQEASKILYSALAKLPDDLRETIALCDIQEMPYREIAQVQGIPVGTVKSRVNRGRAALAHLLRMYKPAA